MSGVQFITDLAGHKTAVIVPIEDYEEFLEDRYFDQAARESEDEPTRDLKDVLAEMRANGEIDV